MKDKANAIKKEYEEKKSSITSIKTLNDVIYPAVYINKYPTCVSMDLKDNKEIDLKIEALFYIEVFQEAVVVVDCKEDYQEELSLEEEIALNVNPKYIENKDEN